MDIVPQQMLRKCTSSACGKHGWLSTLDHHHRMLRKEIIKCHVTMAAAPTTAKAIESAVPTPEPTPSPTTAKTSVPATSGPNNKYRINDDN